MTTITCKLSEALAARLDAEAIAQRCSKSAVLREALEERFKAKQRPDAVRAFDLVKHLCGSIEGGPADLATNPEHLQGFGQ